MPPTAARACDTRQLVRSGAVIVFLEWLEAATGGLLIGLSVVLLMASIGRVASVSGIVFRTLETTQKDPLWRLLFLAGLLLTGLMFAFVAGFGSGQVEEGFLRTLISGLLVGVGATMIGGGLITHAVCGLARGSSRSLIALAIMGSSAMGAVWILRHVWGLG